MLNLYKSPKGTNYFYEPKVNKKWFNKINTNLINKNTFGL